MNCGKAFTKDIIGLAENITRLGIIGYMASTTGLINRFQYAISKELLPDLTLVINPADDDCDLVIVVTDYPYNQLPDNIKSITNISMMTQEASDMELPSLKLLADSDWLVIRELERQLLLDTDLNIEREAYRLEVDNELDTKISGGEIT